MWINKIIFVSTDSSDIHDEQTWDISQKQLDAVTEHCFSADDPNLPVAFRIEWASPKAIANDISYLRSKYCELLNISKTVLVSILSNSQDIHEIIECTKKWKTVVVWVTQQQLKTILTTLQHNDNDDQDDYLDEYDIDHNYPVEDEHGQLYSEKIQNPKDIYVYTIFPYNKQDADFQVFPRSHYEELVEKSIR